MSIYEASLMLIIVFLFQILVILYFKITEIYYAKGFRDGALTTIKQIKDRRQG